MKGGLFITFEGGEGAGKTTLIEKIGKQISSLGHTVLKTREPGGTEVGEKIRRILLETKTPLSPYTELTLFLASRAQHIQEVILPAITENKVVLCDRFNDSSVAYQGYARDLSMSKVKEFCNFVSENLQPDLTLYLDIDPDLGLTRAKSTGEHDRIESEGMEFHKKIREAYLQIEKMDPKRFYRLDASTTPDEVFNEAMKHVNHLLSVQNLSI